MATLSKVSSPKASDESLKRNTDCVYFLASPLTCKKGSECEFRHSESARTNPRDCWYWLNGNCLNPKCSFRHPPLDGLVPPQAQAGKFAGPPGPPPPAPPPSVPTPAKQAVPCIYFQQGYCLKGDICPFLHGPIPVPNTKIWQNTAAIPSSEPPTFKKTFGEPEKYTQMKMGFNLTASKVVEAPRHPQPNTAPKVATPRIEETPRLKEMTQSRVDIGGLRSTSSRLHHTTSLNRQNLQNRRDVDDSFRESSPGFDVLVDYKLKKDEFHHDEDKYTRMRSREGKTDEFSMGHHVDLDSHRSRKQYSSYNSSQDEYARASRGTSSERPTANDRRGSYKSESQNSSDLRHRLSKQRRDGRPSVVSPDNHPVAREYHISQRDSLLPMHDRSVGSRLEGRIKLPIRSPPLSGGDMYATRDNDSRRNLGRSSPSRQHVSSHQDRFRGRLSGRGQDESSEGRALRGPIRKDSSIQANWSQFSGPKGSVEPRSANGTDLAGPERTESDISFDGPKPLSEILKRKRNAGMSTSTNIVNSVNKEGTVKQVTPSLVSEQTQGDVQGNNKPGEGDEEEGEISNKKVKLIEEEIEDESSIPNDDKHLEEEEGPFGGDEEQHEDDEEFDQEELGYDYEQDDAVEGYNLNEGEVYEGDEGDNEDFMDEDDGDDFAKKLGVSL